MTDWRVVTLSELAIEITVGHVGPMASEYVEGGVPFLRSLNVEPFRLKFDDLKFISRDFHRQLAKSALVPGDVVIVRTGKPGLAAVIPKTLPIANCSDLVIVRCGPDLDPRFLVYYVNSAASHHISSHLVGAVQQHFNVGSARQLLVRLPPIREQQRIASVLSALDDKIELNRRMNETLEAMARALFKDWFIDFGPVRAKMEGRQPPGLAPEIAALFPDRLDEEGKPEGWERIPIRQLAEMISKGTTPTKNDLGAAIDVPTVPFIKVKDLDDAGNIDRSQLERIPASVHRNSLERSILKVGDILFSIAGTIGRVAAIDADLSDANINQALAFVRLLEPEKHFGLVLQTLKSAPVRAAADAVTVQGVQANVSLSSLGAFDVLLPADPVLAAWNDTFKPIFKKHRQCADETAGLIRLRDMLLPKLLSGELTVNHALELYGQTVPV